MKARSLLLLVIVVLCVIGSATAQSVPRYQVGPGEYNCFILDNSTHQAYSTTATPGAVTQITGIPANISLVACGAHHWMVVDNTGNVWSWGTNPNGECGVGTISTTVDVPTQIKADAYGNPFNNVIQLMGGGPAATSGWATAALKSDGTVWVWGNTTTGMRGDGTYGANDAAPRQVPFPAGITIKKIQFDYIGMALDQNGDVWTWGGSGLYQAPWTLGQGTSTPDYNTPHKVSLPGPAKDIAGGALFNYALLVSGQLYGWGFYPAYLGLSGGVGSTSYSPNLLDGQLNLPKPAAKIYTNNCATYAILTDGTLWAWGDNSVGCIGNGKEINYATYKNPYAWDWGMGEMMQGPVQVGAGINNFTDVFTSSALDFYVYAEDANGQLYAWGRNKGCVIANGVYEADGYASILGATYPNSWDVPWITAVNPIQSKPIPSPSPYCIGNPGVAGCSLVTMLNETAPNVSAGPNQNIATSTTTLQGVASGNGGAVPVYTIWDQESGPSNSLITLPSGLTAKVSGLVSGTYVYKLTVTDNFWKVNTSTVTVVVNGAAAAPNVSAGNAQTITLPASTVNLTGSAQANNGATIASTKWTQVSGPSTATIASAANLSTAVSGLAAGSYVFQLSATDNGNLTGTATVTITVNAAAAATRPTVSAGSAQTITLPTSSVNLTGTATGNGGATIAGTQWSQISGPSTATIASTANLSSAVSGLVAGTYVFQLSATDNNSKTGTAQVTITVQAAAATPPTVSAGSAQTVVLPTSSTTLTGTATANSGATVSNTAWSQVSGPSASTIASAANLSTSVSGLVAGTYVFQLSATDNNNKTGTAQVTVTVNPATALPTVNAGSAQTISLPTSSLNLSGAASAASGWTIASTAWTQVSGPNTATIASAASLKTLVSGLIAGSYVFQLAATDNNSQTASSTVTITVNAAPAVPGNVPPTVSAGGDIILQLPSSSVSLSGSAAGNGGATIVSTAWSEVSGPVTANIANGTTLTPQLSGLTTVGVYTFQMVGTDNNGLKGSSNVLVTVKAAANVAPTVNAGSAQSVKLPVTTATLTGSASGNNGASITSTVWSQVSGPATASIASAANLSTGIMGLTSTGDYVFQLFATDNNGLTATATVTITVSKPAGTPPNVSAGQGKKIKLPTNSTGLTGSVTPATGTSIASTSWTQVSGPTTASIGSGTTLTPSISGMTTTGSYVFRLTATDNTGLTASSQTSVEVDAADAPPTVSAGSNVTITLPVSTANLSGTASGNAGATIVSTVWSQSGGPKTATITNGNTLLPSLSGMTLAGTYTFQLVATDSKGMANTATVTVDVQGAPANKPPVADAGANITITLPQNTANLDGTKSYAPGGTIASYNWYQLSGKGGVIISNSNTASPTVSGLQAGQYVFVLVVTDNNGATAQAEVTVTVNDGAQPAAAVAHLVANAGKDTVIGLPATTATLNGSASIDSGGTIVSYQWTLVGGPSGSTLVSPGKAATGVTGLQAGVYIFRLTVKDNLGNTDSAAKKVTVMSTTRTLAEDNLYIYPNPAHNIAYFRVTCHTSGNGVMNVYSLNGTLLKNIPESVTAGTTTYPVDVSRLASGVYYINFVMQDGTVINGTLVKQ